ncbi:MAG: Gldg family protein [Bacteroidia bacterium]|nr:Gldg family protein [Bacteroidia bacterium]
MNRVNPFIRLLLFGVILLLLNLIGDQVFRRFDLTKEGRYSLSEITTQTLDSLDYPLFVTAYLEGDFPAEIRNFQESLRTFLLEMKQYGGSNLQFSFENPSNNVELMREFQNRGFTGVPVAERKSAVEQTQQIMWPLVVLRYRDREVYVDLLKGCSEMTPMGPQASFAKAEADLEYKLTSAALSLTTRTPGVVGLLRGHGELNNEQMRELGAELSNRYSLVDYNMRTTYANRSISNDIKVLVVLQPQIPFTEREKYELDQYMMRGGSIFWVLDPQRIDMDMYNKQSTVTELLRLNLDDFFMNQGFKVNYDLIQDLNCGKIEVAIEGERVQFTSQPWIFHPVITQFPAHPVTRNIDLAMLRYASSIDTFSVPGIRHTPFLLSSPTSRTIQGSQFISIPEYLNNPPPENLFRSGPKIAGLLVEGEMTSLFNGRPAPVDSLFPELPRDAFVPNSVVRREGETQQDYQQRIATQVENPRTRAYLQGLDDTRKMAIISDGEFPMGALFRGNRQYMPYDNKILLQNVVDYLAGDASLTGIRSKDVVARPLDQREIQESALFWQALNVALPVLVIILIGVGRFWLRKRRNERLRIEE